LIEGTVNRTQQAAVESVDDIRAFPARLAALTPDAAQASRELKSFLLANVYSSPELVAERARSMGMIAVLFRFFVDDPRRLPEPYSQQALDSPPQRVICDYIAGMTDAFFLRMYEQLMGRPATLRS
jgi:dGTPase